MPRASTLVFILAAVVLYAIGLSLPAQAALFLAAGLELMVWKRAADKARELATVRVARRTRGIRGRR